MKTVADDCWQIAAKCEHWAEESQDDATRLAFRQMAKTWAKLAFGEEFGALEGSTPNAKKRNSKVTLMPRSMKKKTAAQRSGYPYRHARRSLSDSPFYGAAKSARFDCFGKMKRESPAR
jgi:hypothetical protein